MKRLLDISVLIALCDPNHIDHQRVVLWFEEKGGNAWASCPITQNGFIRILSNPSYPGLSGSILTAAEIVRQLGGHKGHEFWPDDYSILNGTVDLRRTAGHKQITDLYLLGLAARRKARFTSLDKSVPAILVKGGADAYEIL